MVLLHTDHTQKVSAGSRQDHYCEKPGRGDYFTNVYRRLPRWQGEIRIIKKPAAHRAAGFSIFRSLAYSFPLSAHPDFFSEQHAFFAETIAAADFSDVQWPYSSPSSFAAL